MKRFKCRVNTCYELADIDSKYCIKHRVDGEHRDNIKVIDRQSRDKARLNALPKSSLYNTTKWKAITKELIKLNPYCSNCGNTNKLECHHTIKHNNNPDIFYNVNYIIVICHSCHKLISMKQVKG